MTEFIFTHDGREYKIAENEHGGLCVYEFDDEFVDSKREWRETNDFMSECVAAAIRMLVEQRKETT